MSFLTTFTLLFELLNKEETYYSGTDFLKVLKSVYGGVPSYMQLIEDRRERGKSTSRKDYYYDVLMELPEEKRREAISEFLDLLETKYPTEVQHIRDLMSSQKSITPTRKIEINQSLDYADKLKDILDKIDDAMTKKDGNQVLTLSFTFLEGIFKEFLNQKQIPFSQKDDLPTLAKKTKEHLKILAPHFPEQTLNLISTIAHNIAETRNQFSDSHFANDADFYLADFIRDELNAVSRLIIKFI